MGINASKFVWNNSKTKGTDRALMLALADEVRDDCVDTCWPAKITLGRKINCSERHVGRLIQKLKKKGELDYIVQGAQIRVNGRIIKTNKYKLHPGGLPITKSSPDILKAGPGHFKHNPGHLDGVSPDIAVSSEPLENQNEPLDNRKRNSVGLTGQKIDYEKAEIPDIKDYGDIHVCPNPIIAAMAVTGERGKNGWGYWVKVLKQAKKNHGADRAVRIFRECVIELYGEMKACEVRNPGAVLNSKLKKALASVGREEVKETRKNDSQTDKGGDVQ